MSKKYLIILAGNPRGGDKTWQSLKKYLVEHLDSDLAICTGDRWELSEELTNLASYKWIFKEPENWFEYYKENFNGNWFNFFESGLNTGLYNSGSIHFAIKDIVLKNYIKIIERYEYMIYTRFDQFYTDYHIDVNSNQFIWIPSGEDYHGICDRHAIVPKKYAKPFLDICTYVDSNDSLLGLPKYLNCETAYKRFLKHQGLYDNVKRFNRAQFTSSLKTDMTNWRVGKYKVYGYKNLMIKYPDEFIDSISFTLQKNGIKYIFSELFLVINYYYLLIRRQLGVLKKKLAR